MSRLFGRVATLAVGGREIRALDFSFEVHRSLDASPNTASIEIYNLALDTRRYLQSQKTGVYVDLRAGYADDPEPALLLRGQLRLVTSVRDEADWITTVSTGDADSAKQSKVSFSLGPGATFKSAVRRALQDMGASDGNTEQALASFADDTYPDGLVVHGQGDRELAQILDARGLSHSWQDGAIQILPKGGAAQTTAVLLTPDSGLVGSPEIELKKGAQCVKFRSLLNAAIVPGAPVVVRSAQLEEGVWVAREVSHTGSTWESDWYTDVSARPRR